MNGLQQKRSIRLKTKLYGSYLAILLVFTVVVVGTVNIVVKEKFAHYAMDKLDTWNQEIVEEIVEAFKVKNAMEEIPFENIGMKALDRGLIIKVKNLDNRVVWDTREHNNGLCVTMLSNMAIQMSDLYKNWDGSYTENTFTLSYAEKDFGLLEIGYMGPYYFNDLEVDFIKTVNWIVYLVGLLFALVAIFIASLSAKNILKPITRVMETTEKISCGNYTGKLEKNSNILEFQRLIHAVNILAENLQEQKLLRKKLSEDVAHELRTPITNLQSHIEAMMDGVWDITHSRLAGLLEETKRISRLIGNLDELENLESKEMTLNKQEIDLAKLIQDVLFSFSKELQKKRLRIEVNKSVCMVNADKDKLTQVFLNIIRNAIHYSFQRGVIQINVEKFHTHTRIKIKDDGIGISEKDALHIFERFYRVDQSRNRKTGGTGIGLSIAKAIVEAHGGEISVNSQLGEGAEFIIQLPFG